MACNLVYENGKLINVVDDQGNDSKLYNQLLVEFGEKDALNMYLASKSDEFIEDFPYTNEPPLDTVVKYVAAQNKTTAPLNLSQKADFRNSLIGTGVDAETGAALMLNTFFNKQGLFEINEVKLKRSGVYSDSEIQNLQNDVDLQTKVKESLDALKNTTEDFGETYQEVILPQKLAEYNSFGKLVNINPQITDAAIKDSLVGLSRSEFDKAVDQMDVVIEDPDTLFTELQEYSKASSLVEIDDVIQPEIEDNPSIVIPQTKTAETSPEIIANIKTILAIDEDVLDSSEEDVQEVLAEIEKGLAKEGLDVIGLSQQYDSPQLRESLTNLLAFLEFPTKGNMDRFILSFYGEQTAKTEIVREVNDKSYVRLRTKQSEEQVFEEQSLVKMKEGLYAKVVKMPLNKLYAILLSYKSKFPTTVKTITDLQSYVASQLPSAGLTNPAIYLYKKYFNIPTTPPAVKSKIQKNNFTGDFSHLTTDYVSEFYSRYLTAKLGNTDSWKNFYSSFGVNEQGIYLKNQDPYTLENVADYLSIEPNLAQYSLLSKQLPNLTESVEDVIETKDVLRDEYINNPDSLPAFSKPIEVLDDNNILTNSTNEDFIKVGGIVYEAIQAFGKNALFVALPNNQGEYNTYNNAKPKTEIRLEDLVSFDGNNFQETLDVLKGNNLITGETYQDNQGRTVYVVQGNSTAKKTINSEMAVETAQGMVANRSIRTLSNGDITIDESQAQFLPTLRKKSGKAEQESIDQLTKEKTFQQIDASHEDAIGIVATQDYKTAQSGNGQTFQDEIKFVPENELQQKLLTLLKSMGIKTISMSEYMSRYADKFGEAPTAQALADLGNELIAFKDGEIRTEDLSEEASHFIIAATPKETIQPLLDVIHTTKEWAEFEPTYREVYGATMSGQELENAIKEEVLGKVLSKALQDKFAAETSPSIYQSILDLFRAFFNKLSNYIKPTTYSQLKEFTDQVYDNLMQGNLQDKLNTSLYKGRTNNFYNIDKKDPLNKLYEKTNKGLDLLYAQQNQLAKKRKLVSSREDLKQARILAQSTEEGEKLKATSGVVLVAKNQINLLSRSVDKNKGNSFPLSQEENSVYQTFQNQTVQVLSEINALLDGKIPQQKRIKDEIEKTLKAWNELQGKVGIKEDDTIERLIQRATVKHNLTDKQVEYFRQALRESKEDTAWFHAHFGSLVNARSPLLNLAGDVIQNMTTEARNLFIPGTKQLTNALEKIGITPSEFKILKDGNYIVSEKDYKAQEDAEYSARTEAYFEATGAKLTVEEYKEAEQKRTLNLSPDEQRNFNNRYQEKINKWKEQFFTDAYLKQQERLYADVPDSALAFHKSERAARSEIRLGATRSDGKVVYDQNDKAELEGLVKRRAEAANPREENGEFKQGLTETYNPTTKEYDLHYKRGDIPSDAAVLAYGLNQIQKLNTYKGEEREMPQAFLDELDKLPTLEEKLEFLYLNAYVGFIDEFWENSSNGRSLRDRLDDIRTDENSEEIDELLDAIRTQQQRISVIQKANRVMNRPAETNVAEMTAEQQLTIKDASAELEILYKDINAFLPKENRVENNYSQATANDAYYEELEDTGEDELTFIQKHVTDTNRKSIRKAIDIAEQLKRSDVRLAGVYARIFNDAHTNEEIDAAVLEYAKSRLLPYYKRLEPIGFTEQMNNVSSIEDVLNNPNLNIRPNFSFQEDVNNENINQKFLDNRAAGKPQIKDGYFESSKFKELFGNVVDGVPQRNQKLWAARQALLDIQQKSLEYQGLDGKQNLYQLPQIGKRGFRQFEDAIGGLKGKTLKEIIKDATQFREDEQEFGVDTEGNATSGAKYSADVIPLFYTKKLKNPDDVTDELLMSYVMYHQQAALYKARIDNVGDMLSIEQSILGQTFNNKSAEASNQYKMFKSSFDANFYGKKESFNKQYTLPFGIKVDISKLVRGFSKYNRLVALTGFLPSTVNLIQGSIQKKIESSVGERINSIAAAEANKEFMSIAKEAIGETLEFNSKAKINVIGEHFGEFDLRERFENSNYNKFLRGAGHIANFLHKISDFPITPRIFLSVLMDNRYYEGRVMSFAQFSRIKKTDNITAKQIEAEYKSLPLLYADVKTENGVYTYDYESAAKKLNEAGGVQRSVEETKEYITQIDHAIISRYKIAVQEITTQITPEEKSIAARHAIFSLMLAFRNYLTLAISKKTKYRHLNLASGLEEEGNYITAYNFIKDITKVDKKEFFKNVKKLWNEGDELTRRNLKRTMVEFAMVNALAAFVIITANLMDDDDKDNPWALELAHYLAYRVTAETIGNSVGIPSQIVQVVKSPLVGMSLLEKTVKVRDLFNSDTVETGRYSSYSKRESYLLNATPLIRDIQKLYDIDKEAASYEYYNKSTYDYTLAAYLLSQE